MTVQPGALAHSSPCFARRPRIILWLMNRPLAIVTLLASLAIAAYGLLGCAGGDGKWPRTASIARGL
ncbi:hypothetical protein BH11MYX4_BH11MYX4_66340 [soil metagenome]